jgi:diguanylate cyclase (GGDEF)-like protein
LRRGHGLPRNLWRFLWGVKDVTGYADEEKMTGNRLLVACVLLAMPTAVAPGSMLAGISYLVGLALLVAAIWAGTVRCTGPAREAWALIALAASCWLVGDVLQRVIPGQAENAVGVPDVFWLASYPLLIGAVTLMMRARHLNPTMLREIHLDVMTIVAAASVGAWALLIAPTLASGNLDFVTVVSVLYPVGDVALFAMAATLLVAPGRRGSPLTLLTCCLGATLALDCLYSVLPQVAPSLDISRLDALLLVTNGLLGAAALHPARADLVKAPENLDQPITLHRLRVVILGAALTAVSVAAALPWAVRTVDHVVLSTASVVMSATIVTRLYGVVRDREQAEARLSHLASHDQLTGLANRSLLIRRLGSALALPADDPSRGLVLLYLDLDDFKQINDTWGHAAGDHVLQVVSSRLLGVTRAGDTVARVGGDEFVMLCLDVAATDAFRMGQRVRDVVEEPIKWSGRETRVGASVGAFSADTAAEPLVELAVDEFLRSADAAMYVAKSAGGGVAIAAGSVTVSGAPNPQPDGGSTTDEPVAALIARLG